MWEMTGKEESGSCDATPPTDFTTRLPLPLPATQPADRINFLALSIHMDLTESILKLSIDIQKID